MWALFCLNFKVAFILFFDKSKEQENLFSKLLIKF